MDKRLVFAAALVITITLLLSYNRPVEEATSPIAPTTTEDNESAGTGPIRLPEIQAYTDARRRMVKNQLEARGITDERVLKAMESVQRHEFVPDSQRGSAYEDHPLPIGYGQTISQPYIVALMTQSLNLSGDEKVLEIGTGSAYQAAVLAEIVDEVYTIEIIDALAERAKDTLRRLGYDNVRVKNADGYYGWEEHAPFDAIIITAAATHVPPPLLEQLKEGGLLIIPLGSQRYYQTLTLMKKVGEEVETTYITGVRFVPMTGRVMGEQPA